MLRLQAYAKGISGGFSPRPSLPSVFNSSYPPSRFGKDESPSVSSNVSETPDRRKSSTKHDASPTLMPEFRFPAAPSPPSDASQLQQRQPEDGLLSPKNHSNILLRQKIQAGGGAAEKRQAPAARIISSTGTAGGTPRSSGEFYSISNHSSETLASEYVSQSHTRERHPAHLRRSSGLSSLQADGPESLMMGYAQFHGSFSLDGSLIDLTPFEQVKKKAAVGGRGGGVVGLESTKRESGLLRGFGWGSISTSLNDLLGGGDLSTIKEMREVASSKSVPLLSTPQSILFVDLQLAPGESRSFEYSFNLPRGLPPTHKGKAIKLSYSIVIGTQRAGGAKEQQIRTVEIPLRILGSVNSHGEVLGHDLMHPYIFLTNEARVKTAGKVTKTERKNEAEKSRATLKDFLTYVDELVSRPRGNTGDTIPAPSDLAGSRRPSTFDETLHANEAIHRAIMRSNMTTENQQSANRFEIARNGQRVGTVMLTRPAYRLGEVITIAIDFADSEVPCYAVHATLETSERVDPSLAVRSESSIQRVTRKVYVTWSQSTLFARRVVFTPSIPISATPEFTTSGVSLEWKIRVEFVMPSQGSESPRYESGPHPLLEQLSQDEKGGLVLAAAENLLCESFDVTVPLRVYGTLGTGLERLERDEASEEGLVI